MENILHQIVTFKKGEVMERKSNVPTSALEASPLFERSCFSLSDQLIESHDLNIIAEFKKKSPSKGIINEQAEVDSVTSGYVDAGAKALSVLTDNQFFGGSDADLLSARKLNHVPILRKDFVVDEYQIIEAKSIGADVILLIAACLSREEVQDFSRLANSLGLEVLLEIHNQEELDHIDSHIDVVGVNNRNLKNFETTVETSINLAELIGNLRPKISESGLKSAEVLKDLVNAGYSGFLIGETFMREPQPDLALQKLIADYKKISIN